MPTKAELEEENERLRNDLAIIGTRLRDRAKIEELCPEYDDFVDEVNALTTAGQHLERMRPTSIVTSGEVTIRFSDLHIEQPSDDAEDDVLAWFVENVVDGNYPLDSVDVVEVAVDQVVE